MGVSASSSKTRSNQSGEQRFGYDDPRAQGGLDVLFGQATGEGGLSRDLSDFYRSQLTSTGNPYLENIISSENELGQKSLQDNLALIRSGGYRGGAGRGAIDQGQFITNFAAQRSGDNARLRAGDYDNTQNRRFTGAAGLSGAMGQQASSATTLLNALRSVLTKGSGTSSTSSMGAEMNIGSLLGAL